MDLRVDDAPAPLDELARLLRFARGQEALDRADKLEAAGDHAGALQAYRDAARLVPDDDQIAWMTGLQLLDAGLEAEALPELRRAVAAMPTWPEHLRRTAEAGHVPMDSFHRVARLLG